MLACRRSDYSPSRPFWHADADQDLSSLTQLGTLRHESQPPKIHVAPRDDGDEALVLALETVTADVSFETG